MATTFTARSGLQSSFPSSHFHLSDPPSYSPCGHTYQPRKYSQRQSRHLTSFNPDIMGSPDDAPVQRRSSIFRNPFRSGGSQKGTARARTPPPAYSENNPGAGLSQNTIQTSALPDDAYSFLATFDTVFLIDDSGSMAGRNWVETRLALDDILPKCIQHDTNGIDIYFLNHKTNDRGNAAEGKAGTGYLNVTRRTVDDFARGQAGSHQKSVAEIFSTVKPQASTPTGTRLELILRTYLKNCQEQPKIELVKPMNIIVITDGEPSDDVESVIIQAAEKLDKLDAPPYQVGIQFFQVGQSQRAAEALRELDDELSHRGRGKDKIRDIVDTVSFDFRRGGEAPKLTSDGILKTVLGAVVKRQDRKVLRTTTFELA